MMESLIEQLEINGYCLVPQVYSSEEMKKALELALAWQHKNESFLTDNIPRLNKDHPMVYNLQNKDYYFLELLFAPQNIHHVLMHFLNDIWYRPIPQTEPNYILRSYLARSSNTELPLHIDSFMPYISSESYIMQMSIILEDQDEDNGCTIVVPGSHTSGRYADRSCIGDAIPIISKAGDVVLWDSRLWHGTTENKSTRTRWALIATFSRWWLKQSFNIVQNVAQEIYEKLTDSQRAVLGFCSIPFHDESQGIDMKQGYDSLLSDVSGYGNNHSVRVL